MLTSELKTKNKLVCIGLMSGTSCDGVDAALIETDGINYINPGQGITLPYRHDFRERLMSLARGKPDMAIQKELTEYHAWAVDMLLRQAGLASRDVDVLGFHGHTIYHAPAVGITWQIGDLPLLAHLTGIDVVGNFRSMDVAAGGQGAPLVPVYLQALAASITKPLMFMNIGGIANVCYIGEGHISAFDCGSGNVLMDDLCMQHFGLPYDNNGDIARGGQANPAALANMLADPYFSQPRPKSLDRNYFIMPAGLQPVDALATAVEFTAIAASSVIKEFNPRIVLASGGGARNGFLMERIQALSEGIEVVPCDRHGINGDMLEAHAFGYLAVRCLKRLPITFPETTRVRQPLSGGAFCPSSAYVA